MNQKKIYDKPILRDALKTVRAHIVERKEKDKRIRSTVAEMVKPYEKIFIYVSIGNEVDTRGIIENLYNRKTILVPQVTAQNVMHAVSLSDIGDLHLTDAKGNISMRNFFPQDGQADLILVPLLGFNEDLYRIGYGAGCYDNYFALYPDGLKVGLAYEEQFCEFLPDAHDVPLDYIVTPKRIIRRKI